MAELLAREFEFDRTHFERARQLLAGLAGLRLNENKGELVYNRLSRRLRQLKIDSFAVYLDRVELDGEEQTAFVNALTTNLTAFFREAHHLSVLHELAKTWTPGHAMRVWSAACSTGEEPYSIAMALDAAQASLQYSILATDIDSNVLATAERGVYDLERTESVPAAYKVRYMRRGVGKNAGLARVVDELRGRITFRQLNLLQDPWPDLGSFDVIFCRNVLIYFGRDAQRRVVANMHDHLNPRGVLCTGHAESLFYASDLFSVAGRTTYRRAS